MGTTSKGIRYPEGTQAPLGPANMQDLSNDVDGLLPVVSDTSPGHKRGRIWINATTGIVQASDGSVWLPIYKPVLPSVTTRATTPLGTGFAPAALSTYWTSDGVTATLSRTGLWTISARSSRGSTPTDIQLKIDIGADRYVVGMNNYSGEANYVCNLAVTVIINSGSTVQCMAKSIAGTAGNVSTIATLAYHGPQS